MTPLLALVLGTFVSEDLTCIAAGLLISRGQLAPFPAILACAVGIYAGDIGLWIVGRMLGARVLSWNRVMKVLPPTRIVGFGAWLDRHAPNAIIGSRFAPGTRLPLYLAAGACRSSLTKFAVWSLVAVVLWTPALIALSAALGDHATAWLVESLVIGRVALIATAVIVLCLWHMMLRLTTARGRQQVLARVQRIWRWEFWPMWLFYAPVGAWTAWLALRYGGFRTMTAANPGMPDGGVVGESKFGILSQLSEKWAIPSAILEPGTVDDRVAALHACLRERRWTFPLVLKPDVGQRGEGVRLARTCEDATAYLAGIRDRVLVQPYHAGPFEAGVFYYRMPGEARGRILAVTDKHFPVVIGDGRSSLEDLVWAHTRYRMQARMFLERLGPRASEVPAAGERVPLGIAGNHAQGTLFKDGRAMITPALEARIDAIAREYDGFFIGRFDVRYREHEGFMAGRDLAIVELNGATAECTSIYDPDRTLWSAYRQLFLQWRLVFAIGAANRRLGRSPSSAQRLAGLIATHMTRQSVFPVSD